MYKKFLRHLSFPIILILCGIIYLTFSGVDLKDLNLQADTGIALITAAIALFIQGFFNWNNPIVENEDLLDAIEQLTTEVQELKTHIRSN